MVRRTRCGREFGAAAGQQQAGSPTRRPPAVRRADAGHVVPTAREQPGDQRVRVPHLLGADRISTPGEARCTRGELEDLEGLVPVLADGGRSAHRVRDVGDDAAAPGPHLVAEQHGPSQRRQPDRPGDRDATISRRIPPSRPHLDRVCPTVDVYEKGRVKKAGARPVEMPSGDRLVHPTTERHDTATGTQRYPEQQHRCRVGAARRRRGVGHVAIIGCLER